MTSVLSSWLLNWSSRRNLARAAVLLRLAGNELCEGLFRRRLRTVWAVGLVGAPDVIAFEFMSSVQECP